MRGIITGILMMGLIYAPGSVLAQPRIGPQVSLKQVAVPQPTGTGAWIRDQAALVALGKVFFWDMQAGSDGRTACATCHFHAGADHRVKNIFGMPASGAGSVTVNQTATSASYPFHQLANPASNTSQVLRDTRQVSGSAGVFPRNFLGLDAGVSPERGTDAATAASSLGGLHVRQVGGRNAPSVINTVFNVRNLWDGRASRTFTGATPFGTSDTALNAVEFREGQLVRQAVAFGNSSLASQAVGPVLNNLEMTYDGRTWGMVARKLLGLAPLASQRVATDDSVLGAMANPAGPGLLKAYTYPALIQAAFQSAWWSGTGTVDGLTQLEANFPIFWGLAIQAYEATLISDNARVDQFREGNQSALSALEQQGLQVFQRNDAQCTRCHQGAEFTGASFTIAANAAVTDTDPDNSGFFRTGVTPIADDIGFGGTDSFGKPFFSASPGRAAGTFKSPGLRNIEFTGPYFHDGGQATLEQVMQFYARRGDFPAGGLGPGVGAIDLSPADQTALVAFMKALSDDRVRYERAPFDHPSLCVSTGAVETSPGVLAADLSDSRFTSTAQERFGLVPAIGRLGNTAPLQTFDEMLNGVGNDGSRAHTLTEACSAAATLPAPVISGVLNAASFSEGAVARGEMVAIFGTNLAAPVTFDGIEATLLYASPTQMNVTVPYRLEGASTKLQLGTASMQLPVAVSAPGIFAAVSSAPGFLTLYATGCGSLTSDALPRTTSTVTATVNGKAAEVAFAGAAPGLPEGANQVNVRLPEGVAAGSASVVLTVGGVSSKSFTATLP